MKKIMTTLFAVALVGVASITFTSCGEDTSVSANVNPDGIVSYGSTEPKATLIPGNTTETAGGYPLALIFSKLISYGLDGSVQNEAAESITTDDSQTYTVKLKQGVNFVNGEPTDADSFINAWNYTANAANAQKSASFLAAIKGFEDVNPEQGDNESDDAYSARIATLAGKTLEGLKKVDDYTFTITLTEPSSTFPLQLGYTAFSPLPKSAFDANGAVLDSFGEAPIGNGPYKFDHWNHDEEILVTKNADYTGPRTPKNGGILFKLYAGNAADTELQDVMANNLDILTSAGGARYVSAKEDPNIQWNVHTSPSLSAIEIPVYLEHFGQNEEGKLRRQAISYAIDRQAVRNLGDGTGSDAVNVCPNVPSLSGCSSELPNKDIMSFNPEKAKELWAQADEISKFEEPKLDIYYNADSGGKDVYEAYANSVKSNLGIGSEAVSTPNFKTLLQMRDAMEVKGAYRSDWLPDYPSIENFLAPLFMTKASSNTSGYSDAEFDSLMKQGASAPSLEEANKFFEQAAQYIVDQSIAINLGDGTRKAAYSKSIKVDPAAAADWDGSEAFWNFEKLG